MNSEEFPLQEDFQHWKRGAGFCFCHYPFVFEAASKAVLLDIENQGEQVTLLTLCCPLCCASCHWQPGRSIACWACGCPAAA